jgi:fructoselysine-6-P-deglycase FrlB-like protein
LTHVAAEIVTQPACWKQASVLAATRPTGLPVPGERVAVAGCGTSWYIAQSYASLREASGQGVTDAFAASEMTRLDTYDRVVVLSRSGTTTEVLDLLETLPGAVPTLALTADPTTPIVDLADASIVLDFADEQSVVQTRFATTALAFLRAHLGQDLSGPIEDAEQAIETPVNEAHLTAEQFSFLGRGWTVGLAQEAALKMREAAGAWTEAYPAMEYRHGPISITGPNRIAWMLGEAPEGLSEDVAATGGLYVAADLDPMAELIRAQLLAVALAEQRDVNPDKPRHLTRSVILQKS